MNHMGSGFDLLDTVARPDTFPWRVLRGRSEQARPATTAGSFFPRSVRAELDLDGALLPEGTAVELTLGWPGCDEPLQDEPSPLDPTRSRKTYRTVDVNRR